MNKLSAFQLTTCGPAVCNRGAPLFGESVLFEETSEFTAESSEPSPADLNPLVNPLLGKYLGRWAEAFYTAPPQHREQAVLALLHVLEAEEAGGVAPKPVPPQIPIGICRCGQENSLWRPYCANCGAALGRENERAGVTAEVLPVAVETAPLEDPVPDLPPRTELLLADHAAEVGRGDEETPVSEVRPHVTEAALTEAASEAAIDSDAVPTLQVQPLHVPTLLVPTATNRWWPIGVVVLLLALAAIPAYLHWQSRSPESPHKTAGAASQSSAQVVATTPPPARAQPATLPEEKELPPRKVASSARRAVVQASPQPIAPKPLDTKPGAAELIQAQQLLAEPSQANSAQAATLLWQSVKQENVGALMTLADLYQRGDGVQKSCMQARVLLTAASRRGSVPATQKLRTLDCR